MGTTQDFVHVLSTPRASGVFIGLGASGAVATRGDGLTHDVSWVGLSLPMFTGVWVPVVLHVVWADGPRQDANDLVLRIPRGDVDAAVLHLRGAHPRRLRQLRLVQRLGGEVCGASFARAVPSPPFALLVLPSPPRASAPRPITPLRSLLSLLAPAMPVAHALPPDAPPPDAHTSWQTSTAVATSTSRTSARSLKACTPPSSSTR